MTDAYFNERPNDDFGLMASSIKGWLDLPGVTPGLATVSGNIGQVLTATGEQMGSRKLEIGWLLDAASMLARRTQLRDWYRLLLNPVQIRLWDDPDRFVIGKAVSGIGTGSGAPEGVDPDGEVGTTFLAADPLYYDVRPWSIPVLVGVRTPIPVGSVGSRFDLFLQAISSSATIRLRSGQDGTVLGEMALSGSTTGSQYLTVSLLRGMIKLTQNTPAAESDAYSWKDAADTWFAYDPSDLPTIELVGSGQGVAIGRKAWLT